ncbi:MAG: hypothetical protein ABEI75_04715 [Halobaculum sp.]
MTLIDPTGSNPSPGGDGSIEAIEREMENRGIQPDEQIEDNKTCGPFLYRRLREVWEKFTGKAVPFGL